MLTEWFDSETLKKEILKNHVSNIPLYGYGIKGYILSIIETVMDLGEDKVPPSKLQEIIKIGKGMLNEPITIINDVDSILPILKEKYRLVVATKGDLLDQQRKLNASGLTSFFDEVEIMSDKTPADYTKMFKRLNIDPAEFMMVGNSLKSDIQIGRAHV